MRTSPKIEAKRKKLLSNGLKKLENEFTNEKRSAE
jgi:hypothetical protein